MVLTLSGHTADPEHPNRLKLPCLVLFAFTIMSREVFLKIKEPQRSGSYNKQVWFLRSLFQFSTVILVCLKFTLEELWTQIKFNFVL